MARPRAGFTRVLCVAEEVMLEPLGAAWVPATLQSELQGGITQIMSTKWSLVRCSNGEWDSREGMVLVTNRSPEPVTLQMGQVIDED